MRLVFFGSGAFGLPTLQFLCAQRDRFEIALVVSQPDKPAGRKQRPTPTPVAQWAHERGLACIKPARVNEPDVVERVRSADAQAFVVIAFGQKIGPALLQGVFAINLHGSILPAYRGAAPIQRAMMDGAASTGVSVITLAQRMDAGDILATESTPIGSDETGGELHDRLALLGPAVVERVLEQFREGTFSPRAQEESLATMAPKLTKEEGTCRFDLPAQSVRARIHGLNPWPGCGVLLDGEPVRLLRVRDWPREPHGSAPGTILDNLHVACATGALEILELQPPNGRAMTLAAYRNGRAFEAGMQFTPRAGGA